jgi:hypothetical protein
MNRHLQGLLALCLLISQVGWLDHRYHHHDMDHDEVCEQCLIGNTQGHGVIGSDRYSFRKPSYVLMPGLSVPDLRVVWTGPYLSRAPPHFL